MKYDNYGFINDRKILMFTFVIVQMIIKNRSYPARLFTSSSPSLPAPLPYLLANFSSPSPSWNLSTSPLPSAPLKPSTPPLKIWF